MVLEEWSEWHLTPSGWVRGSYKRLDGGDEAVTSPDPDGSVAVYVYWETEELGGSMRAGVREKDIRDARQSAALIARFGECPHSLTVADGRF